MKQKNQFLQAMSPLLEERFGWARTDMILDYASSGWEALCRDNGGEPAAVRQHTVKKIYPAIALYRAMQRAGISQADSLAFVDYGCSHQAESQAASIRAMCRLPGIARAMPRIFRFITVHTFGEKAGFQASFYPTDRTRCKFDMTRCLYCDVCRKNGCPELTPVFCHTDDVTDGNMHPRLLWNRTQIMGDGAPCCDFDLIYLQDNDRAENYQKPPATPEQPQ